MIGENEGELLKTAKECGEPLNESRSIPSRRRMRLDEAGLRRLVHAVLREIASLECVSEWTHI
jgi:hypothetical protein